MFVYATLSALSVCWLIQWFVIAISLFDLSADDAEEVDEQECGQCWEGADGWELFDGEATWVALDVSEYEEGEGELGDETGGFGPARCLELLEEGVEWHII